MILRSLNELYDRLAGEPAYELARPGWSPQKISFKVVIRPDGTLVAIEDVRSTEGRRQLPLQLLVPGGTRSSGSGLNPCFLWDKPQYMLGVAVGNDNPARSEGAFQAFRDLHLGGQSAINDPQFSAVCRFLEGWTPDDGVEHRVLLDAGNAGFGAFQVAGETNWVHERVAVREWWNGRVPQEGGLTGECLVTGEVAPLARTHEKVKGLAGQKSLGPLVGFNDPAYESYGKSQSFNAPVSEAVAFRYVTALNALLNGPRRDRHRIVLGATTFAFWTEEPNPAEDFFARFLEEGMTALPDPAAQAEGRLEDLGVFLRAMRQGRDAPVDLDGGVGGTRYYLVGLAPSAGRVVVRALVTDKVADLVAHLRAHHDDIRLARSPATASRPGDPEFPSVRDLLDQTARERKDIPPLLAAPLVRSVVEGRPYPHALYAAVLRRIAADRRVTYLRGCVLKGFLNRNLNKELAMALDHERSEPSYRLGRLFAALEKTQKDALGGVNKTIRDGFYSSASATPRAVFPRLLRTYQHHLAKLEGGRRVNRERLVQEILSPLEDFPAHLDLAGQGVFAIGYYHQTDDFYQKRGGTDTPGEPTEDDK